MFVGSFRTGPQPEAARRKVLAGVAFHVELLVFVGRVDQRFGHKPNDISPLTRVFEFTCSCGQKYEYEEGLQIVLTDDQRKTLNALRTGSAKLILVPI